MENNIERTLSDIVYHIVLHTRKPSFLFSTQVCVLNFQFLSFSTSFSCNCAFSTSRHGIKNDHPTSIASQFTVIRTPSGSKSSIFNAIFTVQCILYRPCFDRRCLSHVRVCKYALLFALCLELVL